MKNRLPLILGLLLLKLSGFGQDKSDKTYKPFSILIISPDSISLHESLKPLVDTVE
ncbi:MAG: hypothetical protein JJE25_10375, partial [Bacteroidia bacterium]|nr:hypothetical protein [Bacteroidia bacterium]